jgi:hypothetical protein
MYILMLSDEMFCRCQLGSFDPWHHLVLGFLCWFFFCLDDLSIGDTGVLKFPTTTVLESICAFKSFNVCLMKVDNCYFLLKYCPFYYYEVSFFVSFDQCRFEVYFVWYKYYCSCLLLGPLAWWIFFQPFTLSQCLFLSIRWVSCQNRLLDLSF